MSIRIFVSYRREDIGIAGRICDRLQKRFGKKSIFFDIEAIAPGAAFPADIHAALDECKVFLAIIGPHWAETDGAGQQKLFDDDDWVRTEIEGALNRGIGIIPVPVDRVTVPHADELPASIRRFAEYHEARINLDLDFDAHMKRLVRSIEDHLGWAYRIRRYWPIAGYSAAALAVGLFYLLRDPLLAEFQAARVRSAIASCNIKFAVDCAKDGGVSGSDEALAGLKSCKNSELYRSDNALLQWIDVWTTSVYSFAPGGGGPGGGLDDDVLKAGGWGDWYFSLVQFKLPPLKGRPNFASMALYSKTDQLTGVRIEVDQIIKEWSFPKGDRLWWKDRPGARAMTIEPLPAPGQDRWYLIDLTKLIQQWFDGKSPNYGIQIRPASNFGSLVVFASSDAPDKNKIPYLIFCS
jgi:TIR domain